MRLELKRDALLIVPESELDRAYIEDTLGLLCTGQTADVKRVDDVAMGFNRKDVFVLKILSLDKAREEGEKQ